MNAREVLERIERELRKLNGVLKPHFRTDNGYDHVLHASYEVGDALTALKRARENHGRELEKVEVPGE